MIRCGIIGCGVIAPTHIEAYRGIPEVEVVHLADIVPEKAEALGKKYAISRCSADYRRLLADPEVDLVSVCTDHASHAEIVVDALAAGKHVVCEKPLGRVSADLDKMIAAADAHPELVSSGIFQHRFEAHNRTLRSLVEAGRLGRLVTFNLCACCERTDAYYNADAWRGTIAGEGGGVLINQVIHQLDQLRFVFGEVRAVSALTANVTHQGVIEVEDTAAFTLEFESGLFGCVTATNSSRQLWRNYLTVVAEKVNFEYVNEVATEVVASDEELSGTIRRELGAPVAGAAVGKSYYGGGHPAQLFDVVSAIREKRAPFVSMREAAGTAALVFAVYESAATGRRVEVRHF